MPQTAFACYQETLHTHLASRLSSASPPFGGLGRAELFGQRGWGTQRSSFRPVFYPSLWPTLDHVVNLAHLLCCPSSTARRRPPRCTPTASAPAAAAWAPPDRVWGCCVALSCCLPVVVQQGGHQPVARGWGFCNGVTPTGSPPVSHRCEAGLD